MNYENLANFLSTKLVNLDTDVKKIFRLLLIFGRERRLFQYKKLFSGTIWSCPNDQRGNLILSEQIFSDISSKLCLVSAREEND